MKIRRRRPPGRHRKIRLLLVLCLLLYALAARLVAPLAVDVAETEIRRVA